MRKFCAIACTMGFSAFWVFGGLAVLALINGHPVGATGLFIAALGLAIGVYMRRKVVDLTQDIPMGARVIQKEGA